MDKHLIWAIASVIVFMIISGTLIWINYNSWTVRFEMDENTKEAIKSIEWDEINKELSIPTFQIDETTNQTKLVWVELERICGKQNDM